MFGIMIYFFGTVKRVSVKKIRRRKTHQNNAVCAGVVRLRNDSTTYERYGGLKVFKAFPMGFRNGELGGKRGFLAGSCLHRANIGETAGTMIGKENSDRNVFERSR